MFLFEFNEILAIMTFFTVIIDNKSTLNIAMVRQTVAEKAVAETYSSVFSDGQRQSLYNSK